MPIRLNPAIHELSGGLRWVGMRDRLRCPNCDKIGTWKPHGTIWDRKVHGDISVRRWLCKWCGYYVGPTGVLKAFPSGVTGAWAITPSDEVPLEPTPKEALREFYGRDVNPWRG